MIRSAENWMEHLTLEQKIAQMIGHDIILQDYESDPELTFRAIHNAVQTGELGMDQLNKSVIRILETKEKFNLLDNTPH